MIDLVDESDPILQQKPVAWPFDQAFPAETFETPWYYAQGGQIPNPQKFYNLMFENMLGHNGLGLAANQIGFPFTVFSMMIDDTNAICCFNPEIVRESEETIIMTEGCLSYPSLYLKIKRPKRVVVKYQNVDGDLIHATFEELAARVFQHEMDHMQGQNFTEYVSNFMLKSARKKQKKLLKKGKQDGRVY